MATAMRRSKKAQSEIASNEPLPDEQDASPGTDARVAQANPAVPFLAGGRDIQGDRGHRVSDNSGSTDREQRSDQTASNAPGQNAPGEPSFADLTDLHLMPLGSNENPVSVAVTCGRVFNRIRNYAQQALFYQYLHPAIRELIYELTRRLRHCLDTEKERDLMERRIRSMRLPLALETESFEDPDWYERWENCVRPGFGSEGWSPVIVRGMMIQEDMKVLDRVRQEDILNTLTVPQQRAFRLGELIDQAVCPPDVYLDMDRPRKGPIYLGLPPDSPFLQDGWLKPDVDMEQVRLAEQAHAEQTQAEWEPELVGRIVAPGEVPPREPWKGDLASAWRACGITSVLPEHTDRAREMTVGERCFLVEQLTETAYRALEQPESTAKPAIATSTESLVIETGGVKGKLVAASEMVSPPKPSERIRVVDKNAHMIELDGQTYTINDPQAFHLVEVMIKSGPNKILTGSTLQQKLGMVKRKRISDVIKLLPIELRELNLIRSNRSRRGGYWLQLPERQEERVTTSSNR